MERGIARLCAAALGAVIMATTLLPEPAAAFDAYWFTQRGKKLRDGASDAEPAPRGGQGQRAAPETERCAQGGRGQNGRGQGRDDACR